MRRVWPESGPVAYESRFNGKVYATSWIELTGETAPGVFTFLSQLALDPQELGQGGSPVHAVSELAVDDQLRPLRYVTRTRGAAMRLAFDADSVLATLPDGSQKKLPVGDATYVMEAHFAGLEALLLAHLLQNGLLGDSARVAFFFVNQLTVLPYHVTAAPDLLAELLSDLATEVIGDRQPGCYRTSFREELLLDAQGRLLRCRNPMQGVDTRRLSVAPPRPEFSVVRAGYRPAIYIPPPNAPFRLLDLNIPGPVTELGATLTLPTHADGASATRCPAVLFLSGSGTHDRNGIVGELDIGTHQIVDTLSSAGFVGLRYDTRGAGTTRLGSDHLESGLAAIIDDALAAYRFLAARPEVDPARIFLLGHSQGGTVALALATRRGVHPAGIALLATVGRSLEEISMDQVEAHGRHTGLSAEQIEKQRALTQELYALIRAGKEFTAGQVPDIHLVAQRSVPWMREWLAHQADEMIPQLASPALVPVFIANGEKDFQVSGDKDARRLHAAAQRAGIPVELHLYPALDHLFKPVAQDSTLASYYEGKRAVDATFLRDLTTWLLQQAGEPAPATTAR